MNRQVNTVPELWKEWTVGLGPGNPSIRQLEAQYGPSWRTTSSAANFFSRRLRIINEIQRMIDFEGMSEEEAVNRLEMRREQGVAALN
ncbi:MAG: transcriptional activator of glycolytic enzymes-domain-containing protein, partial [Podila humilis]